MWLSSHVVWRVWGECLALLLGILVLANCCPVMGGPIPWVSGPGVLVHCAPLRKDGRNGLAFCAFHSLSWEGSQQIKRALVILSS